MNSASALSPRQKQLLAGGTPPDNYETFLSDRLPPLVLTAAGLVVLTALLFCEVMMTDQGLPGCQWWGALLACVAALGGMGIAATLRVRECCLVLFSCGLTLLVLAMFRPDGGTPESALYVIAGWSLILSVLTLRPVTLHSALIFMVFLPLIARWEEVMTRSGPFVLLAAFAGVALLLNQALRMRTMSLYEQLCRLEALASTDALTGVPNRRVFLERVEALRQVRGGTPHYLLVLDLDDFKLVNDRYGHQAGDRVLAGVAAALCGAQSVRLFGRLGGEEFGVVLQASPQSVHRRAAALLNLISSRSWHGHVVTASAGGVLLAPEMSLEESLSRADAAMYQSKRDGKDCFTLAREEAPLLLAACRPEPFPPGIILV